MKRRSFLKGLGVLLSGVGTAVKASSEVKESKDKIFEGGNITATEIRERWKSKTSEFQDVYHREVSKGFGERESLLRQGMLDAFNKQVDDNIYNDMLKTLPDK